MLDVRVPVGKRFKRYKNGAQFEVFEEHEQRAGQSGMQSKSRGVLHQFAASLTRD